MKSATEKQKGVCPILFLKYYTIFLRPVCDLFLFNSSSNCTGTVFGRNNHLHLKELEILRKTTYYLNIKLDLHSSASEVQNRFIFKQDSEVNIRRVIWTEYNFSPVYLSRLQRR